MLTVDGHHGRAVFPRHVHQERAGDDETLLVRQAHDHAPLEGGQRGVEGRGSDGLLNVANVVYGPIPDEPTMVDTDFDDDGSSGTADIDALCSEISSANNAAAFDLTGDGLVNGDDLANFLQQVGSLPGDVNLDKEVGFNDFLNLSANFGQTGRTWTDGDIDCNSEVAFADFLIVSTNFGQTGAAQAVVPEPGGSFLLALAAIGLLSLPRYKRGT